MRCARYRRIKMTRCLQDALVNDFQAQLKVKDEEYVKALKQQAEDVEELLERMQTEFRELQVRLVLLNRVPCLCVRRGCSTDSATRRTALQLGVGLCVSGRWGSGGRCKLIHLRPASAQKLCCEAVGSV